MDWHGFVKKITEINAKIFCLILLFLFSCFQPASASMGISGYSFVDTGYIYTKTSLPLSASKDLNGENNINLNDIKNLKKGESATRNFFNLVEIGNASINKAAKRGHITNIVYVDTKTHKIYIPFFFIPISVKETKTIVYGE